MSRNPIFFIVSFAVLSAVFYFSRLETEAPIEGKPGSAPKITIAAPDKESSPGTRVRPVGGDEPPEISFRGNGGPRKARGRILRTRRQWNAMWKSVGGHDIPELNVDTQMGVAMFGGNLPAGSHVAIVNTKEHEKYFRVQYRILRPRDKKPGTVRPYHVVVVKKSILPPRFDLLHQSPE